MKPILFNSEMVRAIRDDLKTVTRRVVKQLSGAEIPEETEFFVSPKTGAIYLGNGIDRQLTIDGKLVVSPYRPGDILYVRETWHKDVGRYMYKADYSNSEKFYRDGKEVFIRWRPSIHMPQKAARIFLRVTDVRVEKLQQITASEVQAEGVQRRNMRPGGCSCAWKTETCMSEPCGNRDAYEEWCWLAPFADLWDGTIKKADHALYGFGANPWVEAVNFERISKEEAERSNFG